MRLLGVVALAAALGGCASVTRGTTENISISSTPSGAEATISGLEVPTACVTPCAIVAKRSADITVSFAKEGYEPEVVQLTKEVPATGAVGFAGNIVAGGLVGMGVRRRHRCGSGPQAESRHRDAQTDQADGTVGRCQAARQAAQAGARGGYLTSNDRSAN